MKGLYSLGFSADTVFGSGVIHELSGGAAKYIIDILPFLTEFFITLCLTLLSLPFVITCIHYKLYALQVVIRLISLLGSYSNTDLEGIAHHDEERIGVWGHRDPEPVLRADLESPDLVGA